MSEESICVNGVEYEVIPIVASSTVPDDAVNIDFLFETLKSRIAKRDLVEVHTDQMDLGEVKRYTVLVLKRV